MGRNNKHPVHQQHIGPGYRPRLVRSISVRISCSLLHHRIPVGCLSGVGRRRFRRAENYAIEGQLAHTS